jgi:UDP-2-acetamido-3-amino-2,3-dideoxy-glucuronate N-acetyltransferase
MTPVAPLRTRGAQLLRLPSITEPSGSLVWGETGAHFPFQPKRFWSICNVPPGQVRGGHGHRTLHEVFVCLCGACTVKLDDGIDRDEVVLDTPTLGLYVGPLMWSTQHRFTPDAVLFVLASDFYRPDDYIRDYAEFLALIAQSR